jgi:hypothetical protein
VGSKSGLSELERSLQSSGRTDLDELENSALIWSETSDLLHDLTNDSVPVGGEMIRQLTTSTYFGLITPVGFLTIVLEKSFNSPYRLGLL